MISRYENNFYKICVKSRVSLEKDGNGWSRLILNDIIISESLI